MFVCGKCHEVDKNVTGCKHSMFEHMSRGNVLKDVCDVCGTLAYVVFCDKYDALTKKTNSKSCELCVYRTECTKFFHAFGTYESKAKDCMTYLPKDKYKELTKHGKYSGE